MQCCHTHLNAEINISRFATLRAGDVIATGTPSGVGPVHDRDTVEVEIEGIGVLRNRFAEDRK